MTVFIFTDKAQKTLGAAQGNVFFGIVVIVAIIAFLVYTAFVIIGKKKNRLGTTVIGSILFLFIFSSMFADDIQRREYENNVYDKLINVYQNREYKIVEGPVKVLHIEPEEGHNAGDIVQIGRVEFEFSCYHDTFAYNKTIVFGGVLTEGTFARVFYYQTEDSSSRGRMILRIDLLEPATTNHPKEIDPRLPCAG